MENAVMIRRQGHSGLLVRTADGSCFVFGHVGSSSVDIPERPLTDVVADVGGCSRILSCWTAFARGKCTPSETF